MRKAIDKTSVLVTGASSGIGKACSLRLLEAGLEIFAAVRKSSDAARLTAEVAPNAKLRTVLMDVTDQRSIFAAAQQVRNTLKHRNLDGLVNVAGIGLSGPLEYLSIADLRHVFEVNVFGQLAVTQAFLPLLRKARGRIVNISSVGAHITMPFAGPLAASKSALGSLSDALRQELAPFGVCVCTVEPGSIRTPAVEKTLGDVQGRIRRLPPEGASRYGDLLQRFTQRALERESHGSPPEVVAQTVFHALTADDPRIRYVVGKDAWLLVTLSKVLPDGLLDRLRRKVFGIPSQLVVLQGQNEARMTKRLEE